VAVLLAVLVSRTVVGTVTVAVLVSVPVKAAGTLALNL
jgi:hypothetical protein